jgi:hypothetical protein
MLRTKLVNYRDNPDGGFDIICPLCEAKIIENISETKLLYGGAHFVKMHYEKEHPGVTPLCEPN